MVRRRGDRLILLNEMGTPSPRWEPVPSAANHVGTFPPRSSSDDLTNLWAVSAGLEPGDVQPGLHMPKINRGMVYLGACLIAGIRLARERPKALLRRQSR